MVDSEWRYEIKRKKVFSFKGFLLVLGKLLFTLLLFIISFFKCNLTWEFCNGLQLDKQNCQMQNYKTPDETDSI